MCGIVVATCTLEKLNALNAKRGPDSQGTVRTDKLEFNGHVLHLRGDLCPQPLLNNDILCFNGEIYSGLEGLKDGNDTRALMAALQTNVMFTLSTIRGEWALVYYSYKENALYFGRDCLGRRSLLYHLPTKSEPYFAIASVSDGTAFDEIGTNGIYRLSLDFKTVHDIKPQLIAWNQSELKCPKFELAPCDSSILIEDFMSNDPKLLDLLGEFRQTLYNSCQSRVLNIPPRRGPRLAILFSGGLDCIVLAALAHHFIPENEPIDLLNVAFENPRVLKHQKNKHDIYSVPDRITGVLGASELTALFPSRKWNLVKINVPFSVYQEYKPIVASLIKPLDTIMDQSIAMAFWFASRGKGESDGVEYISTAKVLLSGLGADEQLGGYGRHQVAFQKGGWECLRSELQLDVDRIPLRNLGRDDRIISDHGKEVRFPYLDEQVVNLLCSTPVNLKTTPSLPKGQGDKMLLRRLALAMGLERASKEPKRAVQFGARTAKMEDSSEKGQDLMI